MPRGPVTRPKDGQRGEGEHLTPDAPHSSEREPPPPQRQPPATPAAWGTPQGAHAKGPVTGPHICTSAPTAIRQRAPTACPKDGQLGRMSL